MDEFLTRAVRFHDLHDLAVGLSKISVFQGEYGRDKGLLVNETFKPTAITTLTSPQEHLGLYRFGMVSYVLRNGEMTKNR